MKRIIMICFSAIFIFGCYVLNKQSPKKNTVLNQEEVWEEFVKGKLDGRYKEKIKLLKKDERKLVDFVKKSMFDKNVPADKKIGYVLFVTHYINPKAGREISIVIVENAKSIATPGNRLSAVDFDTGKPISIPEEVYLKRYASFVFTPYLDKARGTREKNVTAKEYAIKRVYDKELALLASQLLNDKDPFIRSEAVHMCWMLEPISENVIKKIVSLLSDESSRVRNSSRFALWAISKTHPFSIAYIIQRYYSENDAKKQKLILQTIYEIDCTHPSEQVLSLLINETNSSNMGVRTWAVEYFNKYTGQNFNYNPDTDEKARQKKLQQINVWWEKNKNTFKLIPCKDSLTVQKR